MKFLDKLFDPYDICTMTSVTVEAEALVDDGDGRSVSAIGVWRSFTTFSSLLNFNSLVAEADLQWDIPSAPSWSR